MVRTRRIIQIGAVYHVFASINEKKNVFWNDDGAEMKELLLTSLERSLQKYDVKITHLCIMGSHFHMVVEPLGDDYWLLSNFMKSFLTSFAMRYNIFYNRSGHVWHSRFRSKIIDGFRYFKNLLCYIAENPVKAGLVTDPCSFPSSSISFFYRPYNKWGKRERFMFVHLRKILHPIDPLDDAILTGYLETCIFPGKHITLEEAIETGLDFR